MTLEASLVPVEIADPMKDDTQDPTRSGLRAGKVSDAEDGTGASTAWKGKVHLEHRDLSMKLD